MAQSTRRGAGGFPLSAKFDLHTALLCAAMASSPAEKELLIRLAALITARYNWQAGSVRTTHRQLEDLWSCSRSTVKRSLAELERRGFVCDRWRGVRGEASRIFLDIRAILEATRPFWALAGTDVVARLETVTYPAETSTSSSEPETVTSTVESGRAPTFAVPPAGGLARHLYDVLREQSALTNAALERWIKPLSITEVSANHIVVEAETRFVADYVEKSFGNEIERAIRVLVPDMAVLKFRVRQSSFETGSEKIGHGAKIIDCSVAAS
jgi:hypothetical protein